MQKWQGFRRGTVGFVGLLLVGAFVGACLPFGCLLVGFLVGFLVSIRFRVRR